MLPRNQRTQCETKLYLGTVNYILNFPVNQILIERIQAINKINKTAAYALKTEFLFLITMERNSESWLNKHILKQKNEFFKKERKQKKNSKIFIFIIFFLYKLDKVGIPQQGCSFRVHWKWRLDIIWRFVIRSEVKVYIGQILIGFFS